MTNEDRFARQHRICATRKIVDKQGRETFVTLNEAESPLGRLRHRKVIDAVQFDAGERLRRDFTLAGLTARMGIDLTDPQCRRPEDRGAVDRHGACRQTAL